MTMANRAILLFTTVAVINYKVGKLTCENLKYELTHFKLPTALACHSAVYDGDDSIYIIGGFNPDDQDGVYKFSLESGTVTQVGTFRPIRCGRAVMHGRDILYIGGKSDEHGLSRGVYRYSTLNHSTAHLGDLLPRGMERMAVAWNPVDEVALIFGGITTNPSDPEKNLEVDTVLSYNATIDDLVQIARLPEPRADAEAFWDERHAIYYVFGGGPENEYPGLHVDIIQYKTPSQSATKISNILPDYPRNRCRAFTDGNDQLYIVATRGLMRFNPGSNQTDWLPVSNWPTDPHWFACAYVQKEHRVYILGGREINSTAESFSQRIAYINLTVPINIADPAPPQKSPNWIPAAAAPSIGGLILFVVIVFLLRRFEGGRRVVDRADIDRFRHGYALGADPKFPSGTANVSNVEENPGVFANTPSTSTPVTSEIVGQTAIEAAPFDERFEISRRKFKIEKGNQLGAGEFGKVFAGMLTGSRGVAPKKVAIKIPHRNCPEPIFTGLLKELKIMTHLQHENVVSLVRANTARAVYGNLFIIMEFCEEGSIEQYFDRKRCYYEARGGGGCAPIVTPQASSSHYVDVFYFGFNDLVRWSKEVAAGMEFLASKGVVHRDLAARNILLTGTLNAKISDFGLSRQLYGNTAYVQKTAGQKLPCRWMAVECFVGEFSTQSDVWAYGILVWEIFSLGELPYTNVGIIEPQQFATLLRAGVRIMERHHATPQIFAKLKQCWQMEPSERPNFTEMKRFFSSLCNRCKNGPTQNSHLCT